MTTAKMTTTTLLATFLIAATLSPLAYGQDDKSSDGKQLTQGHWKLDVEKTTELLKAEGHDAAIGMLAAVKDMALNLKDDGGFEMAVPARSKITGKWSATLKKSADADNEEDSGKQTGRITLDPDNLDDDHEDMHFDFVMLESNRMKVTTPINPVPLIFARGDDEKKAEDKKG